MKLGKLRHRITIEQVSETQDVDGHVLESWSAYAMVQASIEPVSGRDEALVNHLLGQPGIASGVAKRIYPDSFPQREQLTAKAG
jgi:hypothetical protein